MTKKERMYIETLIQQLRYWEKEEDEEAKNAIEPEEKEYHWNEADKNFVAANTLQNLLDHLGGDEK